MVSKQFLMYLSATMVLFAAGIALVQLFTNDVTLAFGAGFALSVPVDRLRDWFQDWEDSAREASEPA